MPFYLPLFCPPALGSTQSPTPILPGVVPRQLGEKLKGLHCVEGRAGLGVQQSAPGQCLKQQQPSQPCWRTEPRFLRTERPSPQREEGGGEEEELLLPLASHTPDSSDERERDVAADLHLTVFLTYAPQTSDGQTLVICHVIWVIRRVQPNEK